MSTTATTSTWKSSPRPHPPPHTHSHSHAHSHSRSSRPSTTPRGTFPNPTSVGQHPPLQMSPRSGKDAGGPSPSYFGFAVGGDSGAAGTGAGVGKAKTPRDASQNNTHHDLPSSRHIPIDRNPEFELFRRQSEKAIPFNLSGLASPPSSNSTARSLDVSGPVSPKDHEPEAFPGTLDPSRMKFKLPPNGPSFFDADPAGSPQSMTPTHSVSEHQNARLSLAASELRGPLEAVQRKQQLRSDTLPPSASSDASSMISPAEVSKLMKQYQEDTLLLDLRVYAQYAASRIRGALNLCIPTTLLKRPTFTAQKLLDTFTSDADKERFSKWRQARYIVVYDATSSQSKEAAIPLNVLKKFSTEGWKGRGIVVKGGFNAFANAVPELVDGGSVTPAKGASAQPLSISPPNQEVLPVAGGCAMPTSQQAMNPFFSNIRQNMDLLDGVGRLPVARPAGASAGEEKSLPEWLRKAADVADKGNTVSDKFLSIERAEQKRMQQALSGSVSYGDNARKASGDVQVAGIEKGSKNRYNNIFPFEHSRVRLQNVPSYGCDYVNASYVKAGYSNRKYIATQAPIPATFGDFWRVIWEQDVRVIVMLTAESEGGQVKSHAYWSSGEHGHIKVKRLSEKRMLLEAKERPVDEKTALKRPSLGQRRSTTSNSTPGEEKGPERGSKTSEPPMVVVRQFVISNPTAPSSPAHEVVQIQYTQWPDFGAPASPHALLALIDLVNKSQPAASSSEYRNRSSEAAPKGQPPIVVHCSAGCGRTGTFCTVDSVIDMIKRQRTERKGRDDDGDRMDVDHQDDWVTRDDIDLVAKAVDDFRHQRLSMVQNLRQFVLCYESVLQWMHDDLTRVNDGGRRSYAG